MTYRDGLTVPSDVLRDAAVEALVLLRHVRGVVGGRRATVTMRAYAAHDGVRWVADKIGDEHHVESAVDSYLALVAEDMLAVVLSQGDAGVRTDLADELAWALSIDVQKTADFRRVGVVHVRLARFAELCARELAERVD